MKNLKLMGGKLTRHQMKTVFGGGNQCTCKGNNGAAWFGEVSDCGNCGTFCDGFVPEGAEYNSWICTGPLEQGGPVETISP